MNKSIPVLIPRENVNDESVILVAWLVSNGAQVEKNEILAQVESSKAILEIPAPEAGVVEYTWEEGQEIPVGGVLCSIRKTSLLSSTEENSPLLMDQRPEPTEREEKGKEEVSPRLDTRFSKQALELLKQRGLNPHRFPGHGLIRTQDIRKILDGESSPVSTNHPPVQQMSEGREIREPKPANGVPLHTEALSSSKRTEIKYLSTGHYNTLASMIMVAVSTRGLRAAVEQYTLPVTSASAIIVFEVARLLRKYPYFNAFYANGKIHIYEEINIGFALDAGYGLKVPVIRQADTKSIHQIASEMRDLLVSYLDNALSVESLVGGTFTITDLSGEGVFAFQPLITQGQSAILGVGGEFFPPGSREGMFNLILAFDHQVSEGRQAAQFLNALGKRLQTYEKALPGPEQNEPLREVSCAHCLTPLSKIRERGHYLVQTVQSDGRTGYICSLCLQGW